MFGCLRALAVPLPPRALNLWLGSSDKGPAVAAEEVSRRFNGSIGRFYRVLNKHHVQPGLVGLGGEDCVKGFCLTPLSPNQKRGTVTYLMLPAMHHVQFNSESTYR